MHRTTFTNMRRLTIASVALTCPADANGWRTISDRQTMTDTGYSRRTIQLAWHELDADNAAVVQHATRSGIRKFMVVSSHPVWAHVSRLTAVVK